MSKPMQSNDGGPAFPIQGITLLHSGGYFERIPYSLRGMSLRDMFALGALVGMLGAGDDVLPYADPSLAQAAYSMAEAMLRERKAVADREAKDSTDTGGEYYE